MSNSVLIKCDCGCGILDVNRDEDGTYISYYGSVFYTGQETFFGRLINKIKMIWLIIRNKEFYFYDLVLEGKEEEDFYNNMDRLVKEYRRK